jgi:hypothetical protein
METEIEKALDKIDLSQFLSGAVVEQYRRCGKPNCRCASGDSLHGPYYYRSWREDGKQYWEYIKCADVEAVKKACETNRVLQEYLRWNRWRVKMVFKRSREILREAEQQLCRKKSSRVK